MIGKLIAAPPDARAKHLAENACYRLNAEAYEVQVIANRHRPLRQFTPCPKALEMGRVWRENQHLGMATAIAARTACACHSSLSETGLINYCYDETYRLAHYAGDTKTLYPRLWRGPDEQPDRR